MPTGPRSCKKAWFVQGFDGLERVFLQRLSPIFTAKEMGALLQRLASRHLTDREIVSSSIRRTMKGHTPLLEVRTEDRERLTLSVGQSPHYVASLHTEAEFADMEAN